MNNYNHQHTNLTSSAINQEKINPSLSLTSPGCPHPQHQRTAPADQCDQKTWHPISEKRTRESQDHLQQAESPTVLVDHISIGSESPSSSTDTIGMPIGEPIDKIKQQPAHYGSSSTSFSNDSSNLTTGSFGTSNYPLDQSSTASSSGVATFESVSQMSSTDHLATITSMSRNSPENNTPTMTLTGGIPLELRDPLIINVAPTIASPKEAVVDSSIAMAATTISSLSLNSTSSIASSNQQAKQRHTNDTGSEIIGSSIARVDSSPFFLHTSGQTQSTPSLLWGINTAGENGVANASEAKSATAAPGSNLSMRRQKAKTVGEVQAQEKQQNGNHECSPQRQHTESSPTPAMTPMTVITTTIENPISTSTIPSASPSSSHYSILGSSPLPSVFNCAATSCSQIICTPLRTIVSQNRRRYQMDGFNLDLTYITDRIIAMGYPADTKEALYRNSMSHIVKFLEHYHPGHYKVFNLRGQYVYDPANFHNRVVSFEMTDHHPPRLELMAPFCREVHDYLDADPLNVVAVHCKAGKGRTGVMICAYLCYISFYRTPRQNMDYYSIIRTHNNKGVTIPSQRRYVYYFAHLRERKLNYMPLRCELVGVYLERPPKLTGPFSKGALKLRVACGDVDVFMGDDMWLDGEKYEEEEELHKRHPLMTASGEDHYDPVHPDPAKNCISRRCYGWTVPENKRVFLEGDIRVDIFLRTRLKLFNVKQERKKIGHIWFNTMFTCPGFCGGQYVHGDEAYPYPDSMIVRRHFKRKQKNEIGREANAGAKDNLQPADSPTSNLQHPASSPAIISAAHSDNCLTADGTEKIGAKVKSSIGAQLTKKRSTRSPCRSLIEPESKSWQSHDGEFSQSASSSEKPKSSRKQCRTSLDTTESEYEHEIVVDKPPGLDQHCSAESLRGIYPNEKMAPRQGIEEMIREAFQKNLVNDMYNVRRMSQPRDGPLIPKAPVGRPNANGPCCLMRMPDEHVSTFGVQEIDRAYKNKDIDLAFKVFIVTRCINESNQSDIRLAEQFVRITHQKQTQKDADKRAKMHQKQRKLMATQQQTMSAQQRCGLESNAAAEQQQPSCSSQTVPDLGVENVELTEDCATPLSPDQKPFVSDPRLSDPHLSKYFFRQRVTSHSRHPNLHHHCSLRAPDPKICAKYGCKGNERLARTPTVKSSKLAVPNQPDIPDDECGMLADVEDDDAKSFDDFDFFHPRQQTCSTVRDVDLNNKSSDPNSLATAHSHDDVPLIDQQPTVTAEDEPNGRQTSAAGSSSNLRTAAPMRSPTGKDSISSAPASLNSSELNEQEIYHPSDCSLAPSTSSSCSSSD